jgi:hypothetical protein
MRAGGARGRLLPCDELACLLLPCDELACLLLPCDELACLLLPPAAAAALVDSPPPALPLPALALPLAFCCARCDAAPEHIRQ